MLCSLFMKIYSLSLPLVSNLYNWLTSVCKVGCLTVNHSRCSYPFYYFEMRIRTLLSFLSLKVAPNIVLEITNSNGNVIKAENKFRMLLLPEISVKRKVSTPNLCE